MYDGLEPVKPLNPVIPLRASSNDVLVDKKYKIQENSSGLSNNFDEGLQSLVG